MGRPGPTPAPTPLKLLKGEKPSRINQREPAPQPSLNPPRAPKWLADGAKQVWASLAPELHRKGVLTSWDVELFAGFCEAANIHRQACELVDATALLVRGAHGGLAKNQALQIHRDAFRDMLSVGAQFGLTPSGRGLIELPDTPELDAARELLS